METDSSEPGLDLRAAPTPHPNAEQTVNPAAGQRGRSPEHAAAGVVRTASIPELTTSSSYTFRISGFTPSGLWR